VGEIGAVLQGEEGMTSLKLLKLSGLMLCFTLALSLGGCSKQGPVNLNHALLMAVGVGNEKEIIRLLDKGADINAKDDETPLYVAATLFGHKNIAELLLAKGAGVDAKGGVLCKERTPLYGAAAEGYKEVAELLIDKGQTLMPRTFQAVPSSCRRLSGTHGSCHAVDSQRR